jgi:L-alanine-DL-glutamate epimerase-like enolase superfamily enzyme
MGLQRCRLLRLAADLDPPLRDGRAIIARKELVLIGLENHEGVVGWGEIACFGGAADLVLHAVTTVLWPLIRDEEVAPVTAFRMLRQKTLHFGQAGVIVSCLSGIELAMWDLLGRRADVAVIELLGHSPARVPVYASTGYYRGGDSLEDLRAQLEALDLDAYVGVKIKVAGDPDHDVDRVRLTREIIGEDKLLILDANNAFNLLEARSFARQVVEYDPFFIEEPLEFGRPLAAARLERTALVPTGGYELEQLFERYEPYLLDSAPSVVQPDCTWSGGLKAVQEIATSAARGGSLVMPHNMGSAIATVANATALAAAENGVALEIDATHNPLRRTGWCEELDPVGGYLTLPSRAGWGIDIDPADLSGYTTDTRVLSDD